MHVLNGVDIIMIISEKQIMQLMEAARIISLDHSYPMMLREKFGDLVYEINHQQSEELKVIE